MLSNGSSGRGYRAQCNHLRRNSWLDCEFLRTRVYTPTSGLNFGQVYRPPNRNWARVNSEMSSQISSPWPPRGLGGGGAILRRKSRQFLPAQASCRDRGTGPELRLPPSQLERE